MTRRWSTPMRSPAAGTSSAARRSRGSTPSARNRVSSPPVLVERNSHISISRAARGARAYLAVAGGIAVPEVLGSRSTYLPGAFGGLEGRILKRGDVLPLAENAEQLSRERYEQLKNKRGT